MNIENYRAVQINDCDNYEINYRTIMLNNKHTIQEFQQAINNIKIKYIKDGKLDWMIEDVFNEEELGKFDWFEVYSDEEYIVI